MKHASRTPAARIGPTRPGHRRVPAFLPVPLRGRADGWTAARQAAFLGHLAETRSVVRAARAVGMARETAYRLRRRAGAESFARAWDVALGREVTPPSRKVTPDELARRALFGLLKPMLWRGRYVGIVEKPDNSALCRLAGRMLRAELAGRTAAVAGQGGRGFAARGASIAGGDGQGGDGARRPLPDRQNPRSRIGPSKLPPSRLLALASCSCGTPAR